MVERNLAKVDTRVRFPYLANLVNIGWKSQPFFLFRPN